MSKANLFQRKSTFHHPFCDTSALIDKMLNIVISAKSFVQIHCMVHINIIGALNPASYIVIGTMVSFSRLYTENKNLKQELVLVQVFLTLRVWLETNVHPSCHCTVTLMIYLLSHGGGSKITAPPLYKATVTA